MDSDNRRMFLAIVLSGIVLFGWQFYFAPPANKNVQKSVVEQTTNESVTQGSIDTAVKTDSIKPMDPANHVETVKLHLEGIGTQYTFDNTLKILDAHNTNAVFPLIDNFEKDIPFQLEIFNGKSYQSVPFSLTQNSSVIKGNNQQYGIDFTASLDEKGFLQFNLVSANAYKYRIILTAHKKTTEGHISKDYVTFTSDVHRTKVGDDSTVDGNVEWFGEDFNYHLSAIMFQNKLAAKVNITEEGIYTLTLVEAQKSLSMGYIYTKKNYDTLISYGHNLKRAVDFGFFGIIAVPLLRALQFFYNLIPNYGIAIILLTLVVRTLTFPLQFKSFKSMKKMQVLQPELAKLKEKFKDDPQRMQKETMELFKREQANPLGGCFPLLLQMPIFFAFYKVLYAAVELVGAPFYFWITDLSVKDPYYVLPVLMTIAMFLQQKMTPSTSADPTQQKVMLFMPLIFGVIMKDLPAGLNLYIFVSTIFGVAQQLTVYKLVK